MDLQRRQPAGELAGARRRARVRSRRGGCASIAFVTSRSRPTNAPSPEWKALLDAYAAGVNAGLARLGAPPFEYLVLRSDAGAVEARGFDPHGARDVQHAAGTPGRVRANATAAAARRAARADVPLPRRRRVRLGQPRQSAIRIQRPPIPGPEVIDLRSRLTPASRSDARLDPHRDPPCRMRSRLCVELSSEPPHHRHRTTGRSTARTAPTARALVANDMHLVDRRAEHLVSRVDGRCPIPREPLRPAAAHRRHAARPPGAGRRQQRPRRVGLHQHRRRLERSGAHRARPARSGALPHAGRSEAFESVDESIAIKGARRDRRRRSAGRSGARSSGRTRAGREYAQHWMAHDAGRCCQPTSPGRSAREPSDELMVAVAGLGMPNQNVTMADRAGRIAWTVGGAMPRRRRLRRHSTPESWADGTQRVGRLSSTAADFRASSIPNGGRIWTANAPVVDGAMLAAIGDGGYADGIRARIIRDRLMTDRQCHAAADARACNSTTARCSSSAGGRCC